MENKYNIKHVAIIMDGNGRWAQQSGQQRTYGHKHGVEAVHSVVEGAGEMQIPFLTLYAFSTENWNRPKEEVDTLMRLFSKAVTDETDNLMANNVRVLTIGRIEDLPIESRNDLNRLIATTANNTGLTLVLALSYSGRAELVDAAKQIARKASDGQLKSEDIDADTIRQHLYHPEIPDVDLMIRTGGEVRVSNFLLWEIAYAELYFSPILWPDFRKENLKEILDQFASRERRFGKTGEQVRSH